MGLHTGEAELREGDYFGQTLNRAARIMSAGHGGQILISDVVAQGERAFGGGCFVG
ncbi:MAG: adenylate/guanylate cyclase domain-containing protein [Anaerolineales bacterium]